MSRRPVFPVLLTLAALIVALVSIPAPAKAVKEKYFDRSGNLVVEEKSAAELMRPYRVKNREPEKIFAVPSPPFSEGIFPCSECHAEMEPARGIAHQTSSRGLVDWQSPLSRAPRSVCAFRRRVGCLAVFDGHVFHRGLSRGASRG